MSGDRPGAEPMADDVVRGRLKAKIVPLITALINPEDDLFDRRFAGFRSWLVTLSIGTLSTIFSGLKNNAPKNGAGRDHPGRSGWLLCRRGGVYRLDKILAIV